MRRAQKKTEWQSSEITKLKNQLQVEKVISAQQRKFNEEEREDRLAFEAELTELKRNHFQLKRDMTDLQHQLDAAEKGKDKC